MWREGSFAASSAGVNGGQSEEEASKKFMSGGYGDKNNKEGK